MAPFIQEHNPEQLSGNIISPVKVSAKPLSNSAEQKELLVNSQNEYEYSHLLPSFPDIFWPPISEVQYEDRGLKGDPNFSRLLSAFSEHFDYHPKIGTEIHGIRLNQINDDQKNDLARLIATRGVVVFRNQTDFSVHEQRKLGEYFGVLHRHATTSVPRCSGLEDVHVVHSDGTSQDMRAVFKPSFLWHSDVTYEVQPPSYTSLKLLTGPPRGGGGDTVWSSQYAAYDVLSAPMQKFLEGLTALHSAEMQADAARALKRPVRREPIITEHPLVRTHPVTKWKSLFFNPGFVTKIVGIPKAESDMIIEFLSEIISTTQEMHMRVQWQPNDVVFWDNRICNHSATYGFTSPRRHAVRVACHGEKPVLDPSGKSQEEEFRSSHGLKPIDKNGARIANYND